MDELYPLKNDLICIRSYYKGKIYDVSKNKLNLIKEIKSDGIIRTFLPSKNTNNYFIGYFNKNINKYIIEIFIKILIKLIISILMNLSNFVIIYMKYMIKI